MMHRYDDDSTGFDPSRAMKELMLRGMSFALGQVRLYARKSTVQERGASVCRSHHQQQEVNRETCRAWGLPFRPEDERNEPQGYGGELLPTGSLFQMSAEDTPDDDRTRDVLGSILSEVVTQGVRALVFYTEDRMWRSSKLCAALLPYFAKHNVFLFDQNGPIDYRSVEGGQAVVNRAVAAEAMRLHCSRNAKRGHRSNVKGGKLCVSANCLGFRSAGRYSRGVVARPDEIALAVRIHRMFNDGEGEGPLCPQRIAKALMEEGINWPEDLQEKTSIRRTEHTKHIVYPWQVKKALTDVRLQGKQRHGDRDWPCEAFLVDGEPAIPQDLWERTQTKLADSKIAPNRGREQHALAGILRCGLCGQSLSCRTVKVMTKEGSHHEAYWTTYRNEGWCWCTHSLPSFRASRMDDFLAEALWPLMRSQAESRQAAGHDGAAALGLRRLGEAKRAKDAELEDLRLKARRELRGSLDLVAELDAQIREEIQGLALEEAALLAEIRAAEAAIPMVGDWGETPESLRRDAVRATIRWMALVPLELPREKDQWGRLVPAAVAGKVLICTAWNSLITAVVHREWSERSGKRRLLGLRLADVDESLAGVMELPDPEAFRMGLERSYAGRKIAFEPTRHLPGYERQREVVDLDEPTSRVAA